SRILHGEPRHDAWRRRHADRQRQSFHGLFSRRPRLHRWQPHGVCQWSDAGRPRHRGGPRERRRVQSGPPVLPRGPLCLHWRVHSDHAGRASIFDCGHQTGNAVLRREYRWPRAPGLRSPAPGKNRTRLSPAATLQTQHFAGGRTNPRAAGRLAGHSGTRGIYRIGAARPAQVNSSMPTPSSPQADASVRWGLIAGNGQFPFLVLEAARSQGIDLVVIAIREEASPGLEKIASRLHWVSLGELSRTLDLLHQEGVTRAVMAGQVKHNKIFSSIRPDWKLAKLLLSLPLKNTDSLIGAVAHVLESEGIQLVDSTTFLKPLIPAPGVLTKRAPDAREAADIAYGR